MFDKLSSKTENLADTAKQLGQKGKKGVEDAIHSATESVEKAMGQKAQGASDDLCSSIKEAANEISD